MSPLPVTALRPTMTVAVIDEIVQGEGIPDLIQDLLDLSALIRRHTAAFASDGTFDAAAQAEAARSSAAAITAGLSESRAQSDHDAALQLRNRAYTHMAKLVAVVREAGRYAFRKDPQRAAVFGSAYLRKLKARSRRKASERAGGEATGSSTDA